MSASSIDLVQRIISLSLVPICLVVGTVGNILNFFIFIGRLRNSSSALYFAILSLSDLGTIWLGFFPRFLSPFLGYDPVQTNRIICKIRQYLVSLTLVYLRHFLCVISINQVLVISSEVGYQRMNSMKTIKRVTIGSLIFWAVIIVHSPIFYDVRDGISCLPLSGPYTTFVSIYNLMIPIVLPVTIIGICSYITIKKVRQVVLRVAPLGSLNTNTILEIQQRQRLRKEIQMTPLILIQAFGYIVLNIPNTIYTFYYLATMNNLSKSPDRLSIESFISWLCQMLLAVYCTLTIFLYITTSSSFRRQFFYLLRKVSVRF
jgi:hypothetical protein